MNKAVAFFMALGLLIMGIVIIFPSSSAQPSVVDLETNHREGDWGGFSYPPYDDFRTGEYDYNTETDGYDNVYYNFRVMEGGVPYVGYIYVEMKAPSNTRVYDNWFDLLLGDGGIYESWEHGEFWDIPASPELGQYTLNVWNATLIIGTTSFWVYTPSSWTATVELFEDSGRTIVGNNFPYGYYVYYNVHIEDENGLPLYDEYMSWGDDARSYTIHNGGEVFQDYLEMDEYGDDKDENFYISSSWDTGDYLLRIRYPDSVTDIPNDASFTVYEPVYTATINTWTEGFKSKTSIYPMNGQVYWTVHVEDQHGRTLPSGREIYLKVEHNDGEQRIPTYSSWDYPVDDNGNVSNNFWLSTYWNENVMVGKYTIRVYDHNTGEQFVGSADFEVIGIKITPEKSKYAQEEEITITITTEIYQSNINITIYNEDWSVIQAWKSQPMVNKIWTTTYTLAQTLPDGQYFLRVNESATGRPLGEIQFSVKKYTLQIWPDAGAYLPGETMTVFYSITDNKNGQGVSGTTIEWIFRYYNLEESDYESFRSDFPADADGTFQVAIPETSSTSVDGYLFVWANDTSLHSSDNHNNIEIGGINAYLSLAYDEYLAGDFVVATVSAYVDGIAPLKNGNVYLNVSKDGAEITGYTVSNLKTDSQGRLTYIFALQSNAEVGLYRVAINVSKEKKWDRDAEDFEIVEERGLSLELGFDNKHHSDYDEPLYYSGDTVTVTYTALRGDEIVENVNCEYWVRYSDTYIAAGTSSTGDFSFTIPGDFEGGLTLYVQVTDSESNKAYKTVSIDVDGPKLLLKTNIKEYLPGDTIKVDYSVVGIDDPTAKYFYEIKDNHNNVIKRESLTTPTGKFQFTVPEANVPDSYSIRAYVTDANGDTISQSSVGVTRLRGYILTFSLDKKTYRPGETATLHYKVTSVDDSDIPREFTLTYGYQGGEQRSIQTSKAEGDLKVKIPEDVSDGVGYFYMASSDLPYGDRSYSETQQEANIRESPNPFAETIADMSLLSLILLVLVIIALIFGISGWRRGKKALEEAKLPPWKKEGPLPEPEKFKEPGEPSIEEPTPPTPEETTPPSPEETPPIPEESPPEPPKDTPPP
jgi:hypothetical protein